MHKVTLDFETRSEADLRAVGSWLYSRHPSTEVLCLTWKTSNGLKGFFHRDHPGVPGTEDPHLLFALIRHGAILEAHNSMFEWCIWMNVCVERMGWPVVPDEFWRCSAAKAAACAIPRSLGGAGNALSLHIVKDEADGKRALMKLSRPAKPTKAEPNKRWHEKIEDLETMWKYNDTDVEAEIVLSNSLPELSPHEQKVWEMDQRMNRRGVACDVVGCEKAVKLADAWTKQLNERLRVITNGEVDAGTKRAKVLHWLQTSGLEVDDTTGPTFDRHLKTTLLTPTQREVMEIVRSVGKTSTKKYVSMLERVDDDGRIRDSMMYHGAGTGRWAGKGIQPHNYPRGGLKDMEHAWEVIHEGDFETIQLLYGDPMSFLSNALRGALWAPPGKRLYCADYAAIEARKLLWLVNDQSGLDVFRSGADIYVEMATTIYGKQMTKKDTEARQLGKQAILGLGYGMGYVKFLITCRLYNMKFSRDLIDSIVPAEVYKAILEWIIKKDLIFVKKMMPDVSEVDYPELVLMKYIVNKYRARFSLVEKAWYDMEAAALSAMEQPGKSFESSRTRWFQDNRHFPALKCELPSGRLLTYPYPKVFWVVNDREKVLVPVSQVPRRKYPKLTYMTIDSNTHQWMRVGTYGGKLVENVDQASSRDVMADAMLRCEENGYPLVMSVHDEIVSETDENAGNLGEFFEIVSTCPVWAKDLPIKVEGWTGTRYRK